MSKDVTVLHDFSHQEGHFVQQCVVMASKERVYEVLGEHKDYTTYDAAVSLLVDAGIEVVPVIGIGVDGFNAETFDMADMKEHAPGLHFHGRPIIDLDPIESICERGRDWLAREDEDEDE